MDAIMTILANFFQLNSLPADAIYGTYHPGLVVLSYIIAFFASYVALDFVGRLRIEQNKRIKWTWLVGGAFAMGAGIWSMHFIGMLAFVMAMPVNYELSWTASSMVVAIICAGFALFLLREARTPTAYMAAGGIILGFGIAAMHYTGMAGMADMHIRYLPGLFILSIIIAIIASEAALWLILKSNEGSYTRQIRLKIMSALIMGAAICGMHYTGMAAAVFTPEEMTHVLKHTIDPVLLAFYITIITGIILTIALMFSTYKQLFAIATQNEKDFLNAVLDNLSNGVLACDAKGKITVLNPALQKLIKLDSPKILNEAWSEYFSLSRPNDKKPIPNAERPIFRALRGEKIEDLELEVVLKKHHSKINVIVHGQPILNIHGEKLGAVITIQDITERKLAEEKFSMLQKELVLAARQAGMADIATSVVHNVGNVLNSLNISISMLKEAMNTSAITKFSETINKLLQEHAEDFGVFISEDPRGKQFPSYLKLIAEKLFDENARALEEIKALEKNMTHITNIVSAQKSLTTTLGLVEETSIPEIIENAITVSIEPQYFEKIEIIRQFDPIKLVTTDKIKLLQIMTNLLKNSFDSLIQSPSANKKIILTIKEKDKLGFRVQITDTGVGILPENINKIFAYGFTSKKDGHGFGLHSSANFANEMGGSLLAESDGMGKGATFTLVLPYKPNRKQLTTTTTMEGNSNFSEVYKG